MMAQPAWLIVLVGVAVGVCVGLVGTSGALLIPVLAIGFGLTQKKAQGTALFVALLPLWVMPMLPYARAGQVAWRLGVLIAAGMAVGGYFGAQWAQAVPAGVLRKVFAAMLMAVAVRMFVER